MECSIAAFTTEQVVVLVTLNNSSLGQTKLQLLDRLAALIRPAERLKKFRTSVVRQPLGSAAVVMSLARRGRDSIRRSAAEAHIRALLLQGLAAGNLALRVSTARTSTVPVRLS
jgi:hypothetical protein